jgi:hypothetical protein
MKDLFGGTGQLRAFRGPRIVTRAAGHLAVLFGIVALTGAARLLGEADELGFFCGRLASAVPRHPEMTRRGVQVVWGIWLALFLIALSPADPITSSWDEVGLAVAAVFAAWRQHGVRRGGS